MTRASETHPRFVRAGLSLFLACCVALLMEGIADKGNLPRAIIVLVSPGYVLGSFLSLRVHSFGAALQVMGYTSLSVDLIYWSSIFFGLFSLINRMRKSGDPN